MSRDDPADRLVEFWERMDRTAELRKDSHGAVLALEEFYRGLTEDERRAANGILIEWALSDDVRRRFDALALIDRFTIVGAVPALRRLAERFEASTEPSSPYDWAKVNRIIGSLTGQGGSRP